MTQKKNTRSRAGCLSCRQRHVRCDEQRPSCQTCLAGNRTCTYPSAVIPLRDRRVLQRDALPPGQQAPWASTDPSGSLMRRKSVGSTVMDPFETLPVKMLFKSRELYHYFYQTGAAFAVAPPDPKDDCIALATLDEQAMRSTILIAGIHYSWNTGHLQAFEPAFLFHKVESIRSVNNWLQSSDSKSFVVCVRQILTICLAEACLADLAAAETHLDGVMALFDSHDQRAGTDGGIDDLDAELANHYLILTSCFFLALKSRLDDFILLRESQQGIDADNNDRSSPEKALKLYKAWHQMEHLGLDTRLKCLRLFPYFFSPPPARFRRRGSKTMLIDALPIIECVRSITETLDRIRANPSSEHMHRVWNDGGPTKLLLVMVTAHVEGFVAKDESKNNNNKFATPKQHKNEQCIRLRSTWSGISAAAELFMHSVLGILNAGAPLECRLLYRLLLILKRGIQETRADLIQLNRYSGGIHLAQCLWFWKVFTGVMALSTSQHVSSGKACPCPCPCRAELARLYTWFCNCARAWSAVTGRTKWAHVEPILRTIAWPAVLPPRGRDHAPDAWAGVIPVA
ncbi:hypothetical protein BJY01DRAFT_163908 [Aspergillus pseudoustus]|uniref:Zn(2)-C6 fungal-type domain-containing protein n=1 Tax=Aspergillus pseudoustus TaxID=1810923 RepID=A0ABR4K6D1_9EURO